MYKTTWKLECSQSQEPVSTVQSYFLTIPLNTFNLQIIISATGEGVAVPVYVEEQVCVCVLYVCL